MLRLFRRRTFSHGIHPPDHKAETASLPVRRMPFPERLVVPLNQHIGRPAVPLVHKGQEVVRGEPIARADGFVSMPVHAPATGRVREIRSMPTARDRLTPCILIDVYEAATQEVLWHYDWRGGELERQALIQAVQEMGLVGLGGAAFPSHVKLSVPEEKPAHTLVVNGCECEPYLSSDHRLMVEYPRPIWSGALLAARAVGAERIVLGLEDNKPEAFRSLEGALPPSKAEIVLLRTRYPQGGERQLIQAALGRVVPTGGLPLDVGVVVLNVGTAAALARAFYRGAPLTHRIVTVTGGGIARPGNLLAPVGAPFRDLIEACGGLLPGAERIVAGGPMMGFTVGDLETPVTKGTSGITVLSAEETVRGKRTECVRCGRCVEVCPLRLVPTRLALAARRRNWEVARRFHIQACVECGSCAYVCPARIPLTQLIRMGKAMIPR